MGGHDGGAGHMNGDLEAAGALATAALAASELEGSPGGAAGPAAGACLNCGAQLDGPFCRACGQRAHPHRSLPHLAEELLHGVLHFDTKVWRTLPLLALRPGVLTRRYIDGQRTRHVSPLALFLFTVFLMFFAFSFSGAGPVTPASLNVELRADARAEIQQAIQDARANVQRHEQALQQAQQQVQAGPAASGPARVASARETLAAAQRRLQAAEAALAAFDASPTPSAAPSPAPSAAAASGAAPTPASWRDVAQLVHAEVDTDIPAVNEVIRHALANPELALYKLKNTAYKYSFMLVPLSLPFLWLLMCWRRDITAYDHAVFSLYSLSFMSLLIVALVLASHQSWGQPVALLLLVVVPPLHLYLQVRDTYRLGSTAATVACTLALLFIISMVLSLFVLFILAIGLA